MSDSAVWVEPNDVSWAVGSAEHFARQTDMPVSAVAMDMAENMMLIFEEDLWW